ncbi:CCC motif membrane protein [Flavobacterium sp. '19STA2R22 D10 B1']|uniref:CCC motif membrane protein n=1 Tax=Flavobacterium aerium TaxID=3037261 RepID=UPI00278C8111|nr:CCC motif membrane protein [Flavobacterium sp. '19STA2R22 D10 B1']
MEKQKLPNSTTVIITGVLSILTCCCYGIVGIILGVVTVILANKDTKLYQENPDLYTGEKNLKTGKILGIIGIVLGVIYLIYTIYLYAVVGSDGIMQMQQDLLKKYQ